MPACGAGSSSSSRPRHRQDADFGEKALRARVEALRPDVEAALGAPLGEAVDIRASAPGAIREILAKELEAQRGAIDGGPRGDALRRTCEEEAQLASQILLAKVDLSTGAIHVCPENFRRIAALDESWKGLLSQDALDAVLMHEMVHVFQVRRFGLARFVGAPPSIEALTARSAVIEGHAQYVGRIAAKRRGIEEAAGLIDRTQTEVPASIEDPALRHFAQNRLRRRGEIRRRRTTQVVPFAMPALRAALASLSKGLRGSRRRRPSRSGPGSVPISASASRWRRLS